MKDVESSQGVNVRDQQIANPFPGLRPFKIEESHLFFGREGQSDEVLLKLSKHRFVGVIGPSGSGKSSFIYCGVLPILYGGFLTDASPNWEVVVTRPGGGPIDNMAEALLKTNKEYRKAEPEEQKIKRTIISTLLKSSSLGLVEAIQQSRKSEDVNYLILVDQFEELFRFKDSADTNSVNETLAFVNLLIEASNYTDAPIYVAITMRSDFIGDCAQFPELTKKINDSHYLIPQMTREQKRRAIDGPVAVGDAHITPRLTQQLLNDLGDNPDQLPILQHALMRTWNYWARFKDYEEEPLDLKHYEAIGTMSEALSMHANEAFDELDEEQKHICEVLFKAITEKRGENFGIRRPTKLNEIAAIADVAEEDVIEVIEKFRQPGRSLLTPAFGTPLNSKSIVDISHESLMRIWTRLKNWVDDEAEAVQMYQRLAEAANMYQVGKAGLWRPPDLQLALNWQAKHKPTLVWGQRYHPAYERTMIFLEYSKKEFETEQRIKEMEQKRRLRNARRTAIVLASATVISLCFLVFAFFQKNQADIALVRAVEQEQLAKENEARALEEKSRADNEAKAARAAEEDAKEQAEIARLAQLDAEARKEEAERAQAEAELQRQSAERNERTANEQRKLADEARLAADKSAELARQEEEKARKLRYVSIAKQMALKSTQLRSEQATLKGLMAQQAYMFNVAYEGDPSDNDIYDGLYYAIKEYKHPLTQSLQGHAKGIRAVVSSEVGNYIYSGGTQGKILRWSFEGEARKADTLVGLRDNHIIYSMALSKDGKTLVAGGNYPKRANGTSYMEIYNVASFSSTSTRILGIEGDVMQLRFGSDNTMFYALDKNGMSLKQAGMSGEAKEVIKFNQRIAAFDISADGSLILAAASNGKVFSYDVKNSFKETELYDNRLTLHSIAISKENLIAIGDNNGNVRLIDPFNNKPMVSLIGHNSTITDIKFSLDGKSIATASKDRTIKLWNRNKLNAQPINLRDHESWVWTIAFSPDSKQLLGGTQETEVRSWPTSVAAMTNIICGKVDRPLTKDEWETYVAVDLPYEETCKK
jgi:WD40 repeat protein/energy-coupling factor transporter ATP-binding protein EcfA2